MKIGILSLQGDYAAHGRVISGLGAEAVEVNSAAALAGVEALIIPGGESTTMLKLLEVENLSGPIVDFASRRTVFGSCAGAILMASEVVSPAQACLKLLPIKVERNAYGRQMDSFIAHLRPEPEFEARTAAGELETVLIRAPRILEIGPNVTVLLRHGGDPLLVEHGRHLAATFHAELTADTRVHQLFLEKARRVGEAAV